MYDFRIFNETKRNGKINWINLILNNIILFTFYFGGGILLGYLLKN